MSFHWQSRDDVAADSVTLGHRPIEVRLPERPATRVASIPSDNPGEVLMIWLKPDGPGVTSALRVSSSDDQV